MAHAHFLAIGAAQDAELARAARAGDPLSLGVLFERYRPRLHGRAVAILGYRPEAEDAVHDTFVTAMARLGELNDPAAVGGWLHAILRNQCLMVLRARGRRAEVSEADAPLEEVPDEALLEDRIESQQLRDWVWNALGRLPEASRIAMLLRYFGSFESYDEIATILGVPVGTVRSRLFDGKARLADLLLARVGLVEPDQQALEQERRAFLLDSFQELFQRGQCDRFFAAHAEDLEIHWSGQRITRGRRHLQAEITSDFAAGVVMTPRRILTSGNVTVVEGTFENPPNDPFHCPPGLALVLFHDGGRIVRLHLHLAPRPPRGEAD